METLIECGADENRDHHVSPLKIAAFCGNLQCVKTLVQAGAYVHWGQSTPLHYAALNGQLECARFLLESEDNVNMANGCVV